MPPSFRTGRRRLFLERAVTEWILFQSGSEKLEVPQKQERSGRKRSADSGRLA